MRTDRFHLFAPPTGTISITVATSDYGEVIASIKQNPGHEVLAKHQELAFESYAITAAQEHFESIPSFVHDVLRYLYLETKDATFQYTVYEDWLTLKKEYESIFGIVPEKYVFSSFYTFPKDLLLKVAAFYPFRPKASPIQIFQFSTDFYIFLCGLT